MNILHVLDISNRPQRVPRLFRDRMNPLDNYNDDQFLCRYRLRRETVLQLTDFLENDLRRPN